MVIKDDRIYIQFVCGIQGGSYTINKFLTKDTRDICTRNYLQLTSSKTTKFLPIFQSHYMNKT